MTLYLKLFFASIPNRAKEGFEAIPLSRSTGLGLPAKTLQHEGEGEEEVHESNEFQPCGKKRKYRLIRSKSLYQF